MRRRRATVPVATPGKLACGGSQWQMGSTFFQMLLVMNSVPLGCHKAKSRPRYSTVEKCTSGLMIKLIITNLFIMSVGYTASCYLAHMAITAKTSKWKL